MCNPINVRQFFSFKFAGTYQRVDTRCKLFSLIFGIDGYFEYLTVFINLVDGDRKTIILECDFEDVVDRSASVLSAEKKRRDWGMDKNSLKDSE